MRLCRPRQGQAILQIHAHVLTAWFLQASIMLEELGIPYETRAVAIGKNEQKQDW